MKSKNRNDLLVVAAIALLVFVAIAKKELSERTVLQQIQLPVITPNLTSLSTEGYTKVSISVDAIYSTYAEVTLHAPCYIVQANTDPYVAKAIENGLSKKVEFRPTVYDVIKDAFDSLGIKVLMVKVEDVRNQTFIGSLYVQQGDKILALDIRPSDATAIALRTGADIYVNNKLLKAYGHYTC